MTYQPPKPFSIVEFWPLGLKSASFWRVDGGGFAHPAHSIKGDAEAERDALNAIVATHCEAAYREGQKTNEQISGKQWSAGRDRFLMFVRRCEAATSHEAESAIMDTAPAEIWRAMVAASPTPKET